MFCVVICSQIRECLFRFECALSLMASALSLVAGFMEADLSALWRLFCCVGAFFEFVRFCADCVVVVNNSGFFVIRVLLGSHVHLFRMPFLMPIRTNVTTTLFGRFILLNVLRTQGRLTYFRVLICIMVLLEVNGNRASITMVIIRYLPYRSPFQNKYHYPTTRIELDPLTPFIMIAFTHLIEVFQAPICLHCRSELHLRRQRLALRITSGNVIVTILINRITVPTKVCVCNVQRVVLAINSEVLNMVLVLTLVTHAQRPSSTLRTLYTGLIGRQLRMVVRYFVQVETVARVGPRQLIN